MIQYLPLTKKAQNFQVQKVMIQFSSIFKKAAAMPAALGLDRHRVQLTLTSVVAKHGVEEAHLSSKLCFFNLQTAADKSASRSSPHNQALCMSNHQAPHHTIRC